MTPEDPRPSVEESSAGELIARATEDISTLIRSELALAKDDLAQSGRRLGVGAGMVGGAGVVALYGVGALIAAAILGLATVLDGWLAALVVAVVLFVVAGILALAGRTNVQKVSEAPQQRVASVQEDVAAMRRSGGEDGR